MEKKETDKYTYNPKIELKNKKKYIKREQKIKRQRRFAKRIFKGFAYLLCLICIFSVAYKIIDRNSLIAKKQVKLSEIENEIENKELKIKSVESDISKNLDLMIIEKKAINELNMDYPNNSQTIYINQTKKYSIDSENIKLDIFSQIKDTKNE
ncbi:MAG: hypothetical protein ACQEQE_00575 [Bacillota bacterium]